jgi:hypothetical protein
MGALTSKPYSFQARAWEITSFDLIDSSDSLAVSILGNFRGSEFLRILPKVRSGAFAFFEWISDSSRFSYYGYKYQRLTRPLFRYSRESKFSFVPVSWRFAMSVLVASFLQVSYSNFYIGNRFDLQSCYALHTFLNVLPPFRYSVSTTVFPLLFSNFCFSDLSINLSSTTFNSIQTVLFVGYEFNSNLSLLDFEFSRSFFVPTCDVFTIGSNNSFVGYPITSMGLSNLSLWRFMRAKSRFARFVAKRQNVQIYFSISSFTFFNQFAFFFIKNCLSKSLYYSYSFGFFQTILTSSVADLNFFSIFNSLKVSHISSFFPIKNLPNLHYFLGYSPISCFNLSTSDFVVYQSSNFSDISSIANLILPTFFPLEDSATHVNLFLEKKDSHGLPMRPEFSSCRSNWDIFYQLTKLYSSFQLFPLYQTNSDFFFHYLSSSTYSSSFLPPQSSPFAFQFLANSIFTFINPIHSSQHDLLFQLSAPLALQSKLLLQLKIYNKF